MRTSQDLHAHRVVQSDDMCLKVASGVMPQTISFIIEGEYMSKFAHKAMMHGFIGSALKLSGLGAHLGANRGIKSGAKVWRKVWRKVWCKS